MKNYKELITSFKNKYQFLLDKELKFSIKKNSIKNNKFYKITESKIYSISKFLKDKVNTFAKKNRKKSLKKDFDFISINYSENNLIISSDIETKKGIITYIC